MGGLISYKFGRKNNWRNWLWNRIRDKLEFCNKAPKDAICLYLAGEEDLDRMVALRKGFRDSNLIVVDYDLNKVKKLRGNGKLGICGDIGDVIGAWSGSPSIDVVIADFCSGLTKNSLNLYWSLLFSNGLSHPFVCCTNFLRGRDPQFTKMRDSIEGFGDRIRSSCESIGNNGQHRSHIFYNTLVNMCVDVIYNTKTLFSSKAPPYSPIELCQPVPDKFHQWKDVQVKRLFNKLQPSFNSYKSTAGNQYFDSAVFVFESIFNPHKQRISLCNELYPKIAAAKALRTLQINRRKAF